MKIYDNYFYGNIKPEETEIYGAVVITNTNLKQHDGGIWFGTRTEYTKDEYIVYQQERLQELQATSTEHDELIAELLEGN